ncbi:sensor histidine kinase [Actinomadura rubrisoli]|uniref:histidine kinase n=1 Tax=Actinomadura rubrisoli TaxID=2530368 RepID=A0A4V2YU81_9ACTN|nr:histidine kinase [Actinomadura rubrisoli]TDD76647.1 two-component sensor histidine kinase [Actinomadura rubrisoli]
MKWAALRRPLTDAGLVTVSLLDAWFQGSLGTGSDTACAAVASSALLLRRRAPLPVFILTVPSVLTSFALAAALIAMYSLAARTRSRSLLAVCAAVFAGCYMLPWPTPKIGPIVAISDVPDLAYGLGLAAAPALLGRLVQARRDLAARLSEITEVREHEQFLAAQSVLAKERAQLAREMHDVVSHQVSLIAVRAGALQVSTGDPDAKDAATTIRRLSVQTLDELRHMVSVLRASGSPPTELTPQPTLAQLHTLVAGCGIKADLHVDLDGDLPPPVQRAIYRTVQEALTNARKHAPGSTTRVDVRHRNGTVRTTVTNTAPTRPTLPLPSAHHGLIGLRQRAELLGGALESGPTPDHGYHLTLDIPIAPA